METLLTFWLDGKKFACQLDSMQRVVWAVEITPLPGQNDKVLGVINIEDQVIPIVDLRQIVGMRARELELDDDILIANSAFGPVGMIVDSVEGVSEFDGAELAPITDPVKSYASGVLKSDGDLIVIIDPTKLIKAGDLPDVSDVSLPELV
ncbi:MAG TPA: chemotaxis protein CheW [Candidatus Obscuribacterales bacterium]